MDYHRGISDHQRRHHREAYKEQLQFIEAVNYTVAGHNVMIACFDHEKFPSDKARWDSWKNEFDARYARL